jgi:hypothetical protein
MLLRSLHRHCAAPAAAAAFLRRDVDGLADAACARRDSTVESAIDAPGRLRA